MTTGVRIDQLCGDPDARARLAHTAFDNVTGTKPLPNRSEIIALALELKRRSAAYHFEAGYLCEQIENLVRHAIREIFLISLLAHISEWQHCDRLVGYGRDSCGLRSAMTR